MTSSRERWSWRTVMLLAMTTLTARAHAAGVAAEDDQRRPAPTGSAADGEQDLETVSPERKERAGSDTLPETHTVKRRDTLWGISRTYFRDPYRWPLIWGFNSEVANPNRIYPGQTLRLRGDAKRKAAVVPSAPAAATPATELEASAAASVPPRRRSLASLDPPELRQIGFVDEGELKAAGVVNGSTEEKLLLSTGDHAYVEFPVDKQPKGGERFTVYQVDADHPIREPLSNNVLGYLVHIYGDVVIDSTTDRPIANARLVDLVAPVERGYRVGAHIRRLRSVRPKHNQADMTARVVASVEPNMLIANQMFVVLNRGSRHGVEVGNRFLVLRQGDGTKRLMEDWEINDHRFPPHAVSEIVAVDVQNETTIGWISRGTRELHVGDMADLRSGY